MYKNIQWASLVAPVVENPPAIAGDPGSIPGSGRFPGEQPALLLLPGESYGRRSLAGYSPWGSEGSGTTERPSTQRCTQARKSVVQPLIERPLAFCLHRVSHATSSVATDAGLFSSQDVSNLCIGSGDGILCEMSRTRPRALLQECSVAWFARFLTTHMYIYKADCPSTTIPANLMCIECY